MKVRNLLAATIVATSFTAAAADFKEICKEDGSAWNDVLISVTIGCQAEIDVYRETAYQQPRCRQFAKVLEMQEIKDLIKRGEKFAFAVYESKDLNKVMRRNPQCKDEMLTIEINVGYKENTLTQLKIYSTI